MVEASLVEAQRMKVNLPQTLSSEDLPALAMGLYFTDKERSTKSLPGPANAVEYTLRERSQEIFSTYLASMQTSALRLTESDK